MLSQLTIRNFAIVDHLEIDWHAGLNVITGETGAGKSILIDAVGALLGDRLGSDVVRGGASRALVEGVFSMPAEPDADLARVLDEFGLEPEDGALIVTREIAGGGSRGTARVNGRSVPLSVLQQLGEHLVDIHGQSEHMALLRPREQLDYLDRFAGVHAERAEVGRLVRELRATLEETQTLIAAEREAARLQDRLRYEIDEIEAASLDEGEEQQLALDRTRLEHAERLRESALIAYTALAGDEDDRVGAADLLRQALTALDDSARFDPALVPESEALHAVLSQADESIRTLRDYVDGLEADPQALEKTTERLFAIADMKRKYGESVADIFAYADDARRRLLEIERRSERLAELDARRQQLQAELARRAGVLSEKRRQTAERLARSVESELADLRLSGARFAIGIEPIEIDVNGADRVEFLLSASGDDHPRSMARVASGGELARIALALKTVLSRAETRGTLIFDEIDVGVGGRTGPVVGEKLWRVAHGGNGASTRDDSHQVLCVTHMPQVAAYADAHYVVANARVSLLQDDPRRVEELAAMLAGTVTDAARESARELLLRSRALVSS